MGGSGPGGNRGRGEGGTVGIEEQIGNTRERNVNPCK